MEISWYGGGSFLIKSKMGHILTDADSSNSEKLKNVQADVLTFSTAKAETKVKILNQVGQPPFGFDLPGEYEVGGINIFGVEAGEDNTCFIYLVEGMKVAHLGKLKTDLSDEQIEKINGIDVLFVPIGGAETIEVKKALNVISQIDPKIVIPMYYQAEDDQAVSEFAKEEGVTQAERKEQIKILAKDLPVDERCTYILKS